MENFKTIKNFTKVIETEKAILVSATLPEIEEERKFWIPKSKLTIKGNDLELDEVIYDSKIEELMNPVKEEMLTVFSKSLDKGEKATKLILDAKLNEDHEFGLWVFLPNSQIHSSEKISDTEFKIVVPEWLYDNSIKSAKSKQLEYFNKEENIYGVDDIEIISKIERIK